jgi:hypothetical protein
LWDSQTQPLFISAYRCGAPIILLLKPGQFLHIPKGCYHMFRKVAPPICQEDSPQLHVSIAFDWLYLGHTKEGMRREIVWSLIASLKNRRITGGQLSLETNSPAKTIISLAQTESSLLFLEHDAATLEALGPIIKAAISRQLQRIRYATLMAQAQKEVAQARERKFKRKNGKGGNKKWLNHIIGLVRFAENDVDVATHHSVGAVLPFATDFDCAYCGIEPVNCYFGCDVSRR